VIIPAADLSEQISTAGMEASGTGNMKLALNGALTIGTLDGANIEIRDQVAPRTSRSSAWRRWIGGAAQAGARCDRRDRRSPQLSRAINAIASGEFSPDDPGRFESIAHALRHLDHYMVSADFAAYFDAQRGIDARWQVVPAWTRASILNVARCRGSRRPHHPRICPGIWNVPYAGLTAGIARDGRTARGDPLNSGPEQP